MAGKRTERGIWEKRTEGLREAVRSAGFDIDNDMVIEPGECFAADGERGATMLLESGRPLPTAIFCHTDEMAFGAIAACAEPASGAPRTSPSPASTVTRWRTCGGLTTVTQHAHQQGTRAARALLRALADDRRQRLRPARSSAWS